MMSYNKSDRPILRYVIEHRSRGVFVGFDNHHITGEWVPKFRWSISRIDPSVQFFYSEEGAKKELVKISAKVTKCYIIPLTI